MKEIPLSQNKIALVDDDDYKNLSIYKWSYMSVGYAVRQSKDTKKFITMHRQVINAPVGILVDHINMNKLDNRKKNLRLCNKSENMRNRSIPSNNTSGFKGVTFRKDTKKWGAQIKVNYKNINLGSYEKIKDAIKARVSADKKYHGEFAR